MSEQISHEIVRDFEDRRTGLRAIIAVHSTVLGPACGGCRIWRYADEEAARRDALRLSEGMTYKNALAGLPLGGGKAVIMLPDDPDFDRTALFEAFGRCVEEMGGRYVTAEDVGTTVQDMQVAARSTRYVAGLPAADGLAGGDPSPWTALGVFLSLKAAVQHRFGSPLKEIAVGVEGLGNVGFALARMLHQEGARLLVSDTDPKRLQRAVDMLGAEAVEPGTLAGRQMEVFAPCALGGVINDESASRLKARIICGGANNQLESERHGKLLADIGVLYCPDYLVNAGGIINVAAEYYAEGRDAVRRRVEAIADRLMRLVAEADACGEPMNLLADRMARSIVARAGQR